jgi:hypothetical protein
MFKTIKDIWNQRRCGQAMIEFSFSMIVIVVLLIGMIKVFVWSGKDLLMRREMHESVLMDPSSTPRQQIRPTFYYSTRFNAAVESNVYEK